MHTDQRMWRIAAGELVWEEFDAAGWLAEVEGSEGCIGVRCLVEE